MVASLTFMRPIKAIHPEDLEIVQGQTYNIFVSYGIFPDETSTEPAYVRGNIQTGDIQEPLRMVIQQALSAMNIGVAVAVSSTILAYF